jgi:excinuclease ABC subunit B
METEADLGERIADLRSQMFQAAEALDFEKAARLRDEVKRVQGLAGAPSADVAASGFDPYAKSGKKAGARKAPASKKLATKTAAARKASRTRKPG